MDSDTGNRGSRSEGAFILQRTILAELLVIPQGYLGRGLSSTYENLPQCRKAWCHGKPSWWSWPFHGHSRQQASSVVYGEKLSLVNMFSCFEI